MWLFKKPKFPSVDAYNNNKTYQIGQLEGLLQACEILQVISNTIAINIKNSGRSPTAATHKLLIQLEILNNVQRQLHIKYVALRKQYDQSQ